MTRRNSNGEELPPMPFDPRSYDDRQMAEKCRWTVDDEGVWDTGCGEKYEFFTDGPVENQQRFCGYCGRRLKVARR